LLGQVVVAAVQRIMESFGHLEEIVPARDDLPPGGDIQFVHQRDQAVEYLCHSAAHGGGVHHLHRLALKMTRQKTDFIQLRLADDRPIVIQARRRWWWWWLFLDSRMLSSLNEMGRQVRITEAALLLARRRSFRWRLNGQHLGRDRCFCLASVFLSGFYFFFFCCGSFFLFQVLVLHC